MGVPEPLEEEMRMSESISLPNGVAIKVQSLLFSHASVVLLFRERNTGNGEERHSLLPIRLKANKQQLKYGEKLPGASISRAVASSRCDLSVSLRQD